MIKSKHILLFSVVVLALLGCKKDTTSCPSTGATNCEDIQNVKNFFYFKVGSYWVYEEETSGDLDTVYVTEASENPTNYDFDVRVYSTYQDYYYHFSPEYFPGNGCPDNGSICKRCLYVKRSKYKPGDFVDEVKCFFFTPDIGNQDVNWSVLYPSNKVRIESVESEYQLGTLNFERTFMIHEEHSYMDDYQPTNHFISENVGLIRKELLDSNNVWNLIDYYIEP
jgi:hypothetical protein